MLFVDDGSKTITQRLEMEHSTQMKEEEKILNENNLISF